MLADPKGLQYVLQTSGYRYPKNAIMRGEQHMIVRAYPLILHFFHLTTISSFQLGDGIIYAEGAYRLIDLLLSVADQMQVNSIVCIGRS